ncbi:Asp-tRNA(Asn)/Glu-tRNA(Gln) amidotransferase subunit GatC [Derxia lacustris]|uniref:Asp-tRNA(Asn)/Glu-tRNA(Gln) amidotransferase subunit GatC n=1 Tax=Derxia lacustris TaxID=764842 RepID=UPI000A16DEFB|nr:Asp-tRNA(Asn)/Glu-tRNA(Gln) amidotransferase subunit GatC [Derxia lacustris]
MSLTLSDVERIAHLARIQITPAEAERTLGELNGIFGLIEQMRAIDTTGIEPMAHPLGGAQRLRDDAAQPLIPRDETMKNAPARQDGLFLVPKVIE